MQEHVVFDSEKYHKNDNLMYIEVYGKLTQTAKVRNYRPFCDLKQAIASFYQLELESFERMKNYQMGSYEEYYIKEIIRKSLTVLRFTIAAVVGEARHFRGQTKSYLATRADYAKAKQYIALLMGGVGFSNTPSSRTVVYRSYVDESNWLKYLTATWHIYNNVTWSGSFGGKKWAKGCEHAIRLYRALCGGNFSDIAICFDTLINHLHNGGLLLNKFDCNGAMSLESLLSSKQKGDFEEIDIMLREIPCNTWVCGGCDRVIRCKPINKRGGFNNGKETKQEEAWWVSTNSNKTDGTQSSEEEEEQGCGDPECSQCYPNGY